MLSTAFHAGTVPLAVAAKVQTGKQIKGQYFPPYLTDFTHQGVWGMMCWLTQHNVPITAKTIRHRALQTGMPKLDHDEWLNEVDTTIDAVAATPVPPEGIDYIVRRLADRCACDYLQERKSMINDALRNGDLEIVKDLYDRATAAAGKSGIVTDFDGGEWVGDLIKREIKTEFLVDGVLVASQPGLIGGLSKTLKTGISLDLGVSVASGTPFLGHFTVPKPVPVGIWSGESGDANIQKRIMAIAQDRGLDLSNVRLRIYYRLPQLSDAEHLAYFKAEIKKYGFRLALVDPLYMCLHDAETASQAGNIFVAGRLLQPITEIGHEADCCILFNHHYKKSAAGQAVDDDGSLEDFSQAGSAEWCRQSIRIKRRKKYEFDGKSKMWITIGGSAGHGGQYGVTIDEGTFAQPAWEVDVRTRKDCETEDKQAAVDDQSGDEKLEQLWVTEQLELAKNKAGATSTAIGTAIGWKKPHTDKVLARLKKLGQVVRVDIPNGKSTWKGWKLAENPIE